MVILICLGNRAALQHLRLVYSAGTGYGVSFKEVNRVMKASRNAVLYSLSINFYLHHPTLILYAHFW